MFFSYKVLDKHGNELHGRVEANNRTNAISLLQSKGYLITELVEGSETNLLDIKLFERVRIADLLFFSKQMSTLFSTGVSALRAFNLVSENTQNKYFQKILQNITRRIEQGSSIEKAFSQYDYIFGEFFVAILAVGEKSGTLSKSFQYLGDHIERVSEIQSKVRKALTYPIIVVVLFVSVIVLMLVTVIPQISQILIQSGAELPLMTKIVIGASNFMKNNIFIFLGALCVIIITFILYIRTEDGKSWIDGLLLDMPLFGKLTREFNLIKLASNLAVMLSSGVSIVPALETVERVITNTEYKKIVAQLSREVQAGAPLSQAIANQPRLGKTIAQIIKIGEETGELSKMLNVITAFYQKQLENTTNLLLDLIQPTVVVALGLSVGLLIGSVILPIYSLTNAI